VLQWKEESLRLLVSFKYSLRRKSLVLTSTLSTVEIGDPSKFQKRFVRNALQGVTNILSNLKMIPDDKQSADYDPVVCAKSVSLGGSYSLLFTCDLLTY
jgi:hypothetical protein